MFFFFVLLGDQPGAIIEKWAAYLESKKHHPNALGIQFVMIGDNPAAEKALADLAQINARVSPTEYFRGLL